MKIVKKIFQQTEKNKIRGTLKKKLTAKVTSNQIDQTHHSKLFCTGFSFTK